jgi:hypothetical protein
MNYTIIGIIIFVLGCGSSFAFHRFNKTKSKAYLDIALGLMLVEIEAMKARDMQKQRDSTHKRQGT